VPTINRSAEFRDHQTEVSLRKGRIETFETIPRILGRSDDRDEDKQARLRPCFMSAWKVEWIRGGAVDDAGPVCSRSASTERVLSLSCVLSIRLPRHRPPSPSPNLPSSGFSAGISDGSESSQITQERLAELADLNLGRCRRFPTGRCCAAHAHRKSRP